jgi:hypothetical protein
MFAPSLQVVANSLVFMVNSFKITSAPMLEGEQINTFFAPEAINILAIPAKV